ncbi:MAG TPA: polysaccharide biosynthesis C-terminal domain-containing protein, partial [Thermoanaerobaculia bacterium]|nr:polysaccharide biosynthesis C-terminal domain-containing protein [Thermoanaerobaculia bacterium]
AVLRLLAIGLLFSALGSVSAAVLQALGRPDLTARLRLAELLVFLPAGALLIRQWGAEGAALGALLRAVLDASALHLIAGRQLRNGSPSSLGVESNKVPVRSG